jgi:palmitoyl-protein thioesterase
MMTMRKFSSLLLVVFVVNALEDEIATRTKRHLRSTIRDDDMVATTTRARNGQGPCFDDLYETHPVLCEYLDRLVDEPHVVAKELYEFNKQYNLLVGHDWKFPATSLEQQQSLSSSKRTSQSVQQLPVVFAHGMGDSCFNSGMVHIVNHTSQLLGGDVHVTCIPVGSTQSEDTTNGYFLNMDASVDVFASNVAADLQLKNGFHAIGFSQGNNVIRGYIARYNAPTVHTFLSVNGVNAGEGTVPGCFPNNHDDVIDDRINSKRFQLGGLCDLLLEQASRRAYTDFAQEHSFQANYWRDPRQSQLESYYKYSQLARWNNEGPQNNNQTLKENYGKTSNFIWIKATEDGMVWPKEGEQWGCPNPKDPFNLPIVEMKQTEWYTRDLFGLQTADRAGKNYFESFVGDHLQFTMEDFNRWVTTYLKDDGSTANNDNGEGQDVVSVA